MTSRIILAAALVAAATLAGCGKQSELERPMARGPGDPNLQQGQSAAARARADSAGISDPEAPQSAREVRSYEEAPVAPPRAAPIAGSGSDPFAAPNQGSLPDPYNHPERPG